MDDTQMINLIKPHKYIDWRYFTKLVSQLHVQNGRGAQRA